MDRYFVTSSLIFIKLLVNLKEKIPTTTTNTCSAESKTGFITLISLSINAESLFRLKKEFEPYPLF